MLVVSRLDALRLIAFSLLMSVVFNTQALADEKGSALFNSCISCHGKHAQGTESANAPSLAGQQSSYLERQLINFARGIRGAHEKDILGKSMQPFAQLVSDNGNRKALSDYLSSLASPTQYKQAEGNLMNGSRYYQAKCGACHGGIAQGNEVFNAPKLSGQSLPYLNRQMDNFKTGVRGAHHEDKLGRQMAMMSKVVSDQELKDIFFYISQQP